MLSSSYGEQFVLLDMKGGIMYKFCGPRTNPIKTLLEFLAEFGYRVIFDK